MFGKNRQKGMEKKSDYSQGAERKRFEAIRDEAAESGHLNAALSKAGVSKSEYAAWLNRFAAASYDPLSDLDPSDKI